MLPVVAGGLRTNRLPFGDETGLLAILAGHLLPPVETGGIVTSQFVAARRGAKLGARSVCGAPHHVRAHRRVRNWRAARRDECRLRLLLVVP